MAVSSTSKYDQPEVENVTQGHSPSATFSTESSAFDNDECHMTAFRTISEAAHRCSYDKKYCIIITLQDKGGNWQADVHLGKCH